jgi:3-oxoadipate enol-lactonase
MKAKLNGIEIYYELDGAEGKPWLVFSHSLACSVRMWDNEVAAFKDRYRVLAFDTRGHGGSSAPAGDYTLELLADDLHALLGHLGVSKPHFVGLSMGGMIGQTYALKHPGAFASLTLADTSSRFPPEAGPLWEQRIQVAREKGMQALVAPTLERWFTEAYRKSGAEPLKKISGLIASTPVDGYVGCCRAIPRISTTERLKEIKCPSLVVCGEQDAGTPPAMARAIHENLPGSKLVMIPNAAHLANVEQPQAFRQALESFLGALR